ncbi:MAG: type II toxin-antitoxin system HicA family toxin [Oscillospiraceae bacterium]|jgi:predicted RNA binding protein YcfA (HicA-like mRNA interferase family)|nr:type II toxin-antitoxin system HicA family toxin [Oscillospiraceae bacterium]
MRPSEFVRRIKKEGFRFDHHGTNHDFYIRDTDKKLVMVERHNAEIHPKTLSKMLKDVGLK